MMNRPLAPDYTVVWHNPDPEYYVEGSGLLNLGGDRWLAAVPVVPRVGWKERRADHSRTHLLRSEDAGRTWRKTAELPYYSAVPWQHAGRTYLFAMKGGRTVRNDDLLLLRSDDAGASWSEPLTLFEGHYWNCHTSMVVLHERLYWAVDDLSLGTLRGPCLLVGDLRRELMDRAAWRLSAPVPYPGVPDALIAPRFADKGGNYLEPNVIALNGRPRVLMTVKPARQTTTGLCAVLDAEADGEAVTLSFTQYHPMPGGQLKFGIAQDPRSGLYWAAVNLPADGQEVKGWETERDKPRSPRNWSPDRGGNDRRFLMLMVGVDGLNWFPAGCIARAETLSQSFMYPMPVIDGQDLCLISRTSIAAPNRHDADHATFHRIRDFRDLAMPLKPLTEPNKP